MQLYPDMGVAAMLKNQWGDPGFAVGSLSDRTPYQEEDDIIIFAAPDPQGWSLRVDRLAKSRHNSYLSRHQSG